MPTTERKTVDPIIQPIKGTYSYDLDFLKKNSPGLVELESDSGKAKVLISGHYQGRVMTSTAAGDSGNSFGWINYDLIASRQIKPHINPVGGEERIWLGPEGGQYSIYFRKGDTFDLAHWWVPGFIDTTTYQLVSSDKKNALFTTKASFANYSGTEFSVDITRKISLLDKSQVEAKLGTTLPAGVDFVAYQTVNQLKNIGSSDWKKESGLLSIWLLGMMNPSDQTKVIIPFKPGANVRSYITDNYFGAIPADRLQVKDSVLYFRADGKSRGKIGISPKIAKPIAGSYDFSRNVLTLIIPKVDENVPYVNSKWEIQKKPYDGDVINSYNDGPTKDGQLGPFYEIESSSSVKELKSGGVLEYNQTTIHLQGEYKALSELARQVLGVNLDEVRQW
ncbi:MAG: hypothetical protein C5B59_07445 [Bacteroidetes bacterium]|nr:MAG: hypothetical protein C5B59_07445 [Bacteroidota bacterium]